METISAPIAPTDRTERVNSRDEYEGCGNSALFMRPMRPVDGGNQDSVWQESDLVFSAKDAGLQFPTRPSPMTRAWIRGDLTASALPRTTEIHRSPPFGIVSMCCCAARRRTVTVGGKSRCHFGIWCAAVRTGGILCH